MEKTTKIKTADGRILEFTTAHDSIEDLKKYVAEWLAGEETVCLTNQDFDKLRELFQFNGARE